MSELMLAVSDIPRLRQHAFIRSETTDVRVLPIDINSTRSEKT